MMISTFNLTYADDGSVNEYVYVCMYVCMKIQYILLQQNYHNILSELNTTLLLTPSLSVILPH
jgi:hypothetical protein